MQLVERHGGGSHYVRPDRVYRTGVLTSTMGYDPGADVQSVAASFTQYPMDLSTSGLQGLGANVGLIDKLRIKFATWKARRAARAGMRDFGAVRNVAYARVGEEIAPHMVSKEQMLAHLMQGSLPPNFARAQAETSWRDRANPWWTAR
jgi:hypothetical protein